MTPNDEAELRTTLKRIYAEAVGDELLDKTDRKLLRRAFPRNDDVENALVAVEEDIDAQRERWTIHSEWEPETPSDDTVIRRYLSFDRFESLLRSAGLWFSRIDGFSDQFEATLPKPNAKLRSAVKQWAGRDPSTTDHNEEVIPGSMLSYSRYFHKRNAFTDEREFRAVFEDKAALTPDHAGFDGAQVHGLLTGREMGVADSGQLVSVDTEDLIDAVVLRPNSSDTVRQLVELTLENYGVDATVRRSRLDEPPH